MRVNSIAEQSTRYCNYNKDQFGNEITINLPECVRNEEEYSIRLEGLNDIAFKDYCLDVAMGNLGMWSSLAYWLDRKSVV